MSRFPFYITLNQLDILEDTLNKELAESLEDTDTAVDIIKMQTQLADLKEWADEAISDEDIQEVKDEDEYYATKYGD